MALLAVLATFIAHFSIELADLVLGSAGMTHRTTATRSTSRKVALTLLGVLRGSLLLLLKCFLKRFLEFTFLIILHFIMIVLLILVIFHILLLLLPLHQLPQLPQLIL